MPEYMYACHVSPTVTCQYYTSRTYYHNESPISFLPELLRIWPRDTRAISISLCFSSIERYKIIRVLHSVAMEDRVSWTTLGWERNISCELTAKKLPRHFLCYVFCVTFARTYNAVHIVCISCVYCNHSWGIAIRILRPKQKKPRGDRNTRFRTCEHL